MSIHIYLIPISSYEELVHVVMMQEIPNNVRIPSATEWHLPLQLHGEPLPYRSRVPSVGKCADTRRVTFGSPSVGSLRCTGRTAWLERRRKQAGHTLLDDVFPIFMALVELFGEAPADIQARGRLLQHLVPRARAQDQRCECAVGSYWALPLDRRCKVRDASFASGTFFHQERKNHLADAVVLSGDQRREHPPL